MSSLPPSALASLDDSLVLPFESVEQLRAPIQSTSKKSSSSLRQPQNPPRPCVR
jgi:hypothetical protein